MTSRYATERLSSAIKRHLVYVKATQATLEAARLASEITEVVLVELSSAGLSREGLEHLFASANGETKMKLHARG